MKKATGMSTTGNLQEALEAAVAQAKQDSSSLRVEWTLHKISGVNGGIVPQSEVTVVIEYK